MTPDMDSGPQDSRWDLALRHEGRTDWVLLVTCAGDEDTGGGLCVFDGKKLDTIDRLSSAGLRVEGGRIIRMLRAALSTGGGEFLVYDARGVRQYFRVDELSDGHFFAWDGRHIIAASTGTNSVLWINLAGEVERVWRMPGEDDSCHLNEIVLHAGNLYACAFGTYANYRGYKGHERSGHGHVSNLKTGERVAEGLCEPHSPRVIGGHWWVCNSMMSEVIEFEDDGRTAKRVIKLNCFTRGLAASDDYVFVGESARRSDRGRVTGGSVAVVSRHTYETVARLPLPFQEISEIALAPEELIEGLRRGFRTNLLRVREQDQLALFRSVGIEPHRLWAVADPLSPDQCRVEVEASPPERFEAGKLTLVACTIRNRSESFYASALFYPVSISYKWQPTEHSPAIDHQEGLRTAIPKTLCPGESCECRIEILPPPVPGEFLLTITLVQEGVCWFDEIEPLNGWSAIVEVTEPDAAGLATGSTPDSTRSSPADVVQQRPLG